MMGGLASGAIVILHVVVIALGEPAYRYFGAGEEIARAAARGEVWPAGLTLAIAAMFALFAACALAAARRPEGRTTLRAALVAIACIFLLRGIVVFPQGLASLGDSAALPFRFFVSSAASLVIGCIYAWGTLASWTRFRPAAARPRP
jgi:hypothetical protein